MMKTYLEKARAAEETGDVYEALCNAGRARMLYSSAQPQETVQNDLYEAILFYQALLKRSSTLEPLAELPYRYHIRTCPLHLDKSYMPEVAEMEPILATGRN